MSAAVAGRAAGARFRYRAIDAQQQSQQGELRADTAQDALQQLQLRDLKVLDLQRLDAEVTTDDGSANPDGKGALSFVASSRVGAADRIALLQEFATLLTAGVPVAEATPSLAAAYVGTALGGPLKRLRRSIQGGQPVALAFRQAGLGLPEHSLSLIGAGEAAGRLGAALQSAAQQLEYEESVRQQMRTALVYPAVLVAAGAMAVFIIFVAVVPRFAALLGNGRAEIPALSRWVIETGLFFKDHLLGSGLVLVGVLGAAVLALRNSAVRQALLEALSRLPVTGPWLRSSEVGRWATLLATLLEHRVPLLDALGLSSRAVLLQRIRQQLVAAQAEIRRGRALSEVLGEQGWISATRVNLVRVGERAGELPKMLAQLGKVQTETARQQLQRVLALIEPLAILLIGSVIGVIMVGVVLAITSLNTARL